MPMRRVWQNSLVVLGHSESRKQIFSLPIVWFTLGGVDWPNSASIRNASKNDLSSTLEPYAKRRQW